LTGYPSERVNVLHYQNINRGATGTDAFNDKRRSNRHGGLRTVARMLFQPVPAFDPHAEPVVMADASPGEIRMVADRPVTRYFRASAEISDVVIDA